MKTLKPLLKIALLLVLVFVLYKAGELVYFAIRYSPEYVYQEVATNAGTVYDYEILPERVLTASTNPFSFTSAPDEARVLAAFETNPDLAEFEDLLVSTGTQAFLVIQDDKILYEKYFNGSQRDSLVTSMSIAKSFDSAMIGIAIAEGYIKSIDDSITDYIPELLDRDQHFQAITIRNLLAMRSGLRYDEERYSYSSDGTLTYGFPDLRRLALTETEIVDEPDQYWLYNNYHPLLLGLILERATGTTVTAFLQEKIWSKIGMEFDGSWSVDKEDIPFEKMESGINARAIDFAKLGRLYLNQGNWNGVQVIPAEWVAETTSKDGSSPVEGDFFYKYMWWGVSSSHGDDFFALGNFGQYIYVSPSQSLIIARFGESYGDGIGGLDWPGAFSKFAGVLPLASK